MRNCILQNFPFLEDDFDALTDYELFCKMMAYVRKMSKQFNDFQVRLDKYENYFNNLDVQEEINNKLDEMYENGELDSLIEDFLNLSVMFIYDNLNDLKSATNLVDGSNVKTLGYYDINDGGNAYYKIRTKTNEDVIDDKFIVGLSNENLIAELLYKDINIKSIGAYGDDTHDDSSIIQLAITKLSSYGGNLILPKATYLCENSIVIPDNNSLINIIGNNSTINVNIDTNNSKFITAESVSNYCRITFKDLIINNNSSVIVDGISLKKVTERTVIDNVRIAGFNNNIKLENCWNLTFIKLISVNATNNGIECIDVCNACNFNSCIFINNAVYNIHLVGRGHAFNQCDLSVYLNDSYNYLDGCSGVSFNGCYYEENNITNGFNIRQCRGISFNGCYFELRSNIENYIFINSNNSYGIKIQGCEFRSLSTINDNSYLIYIQEGSTVTVDTCDFRDCKKVIYIINSNLSIINNKLDTVTCFITQNNHIYARIDGNILLASDYSNCVIPHPEVANIHINNLILYGNTASRPNGTYIGQQYYNTQTSNLDIYNGTSW